MTHIPTQESGIEKVYRIARELGIGLEEAADTCDAFHLAFSDERLRRSIFRMIDQLDESAWKKGEPMGLIIRYTVELGEDGIRVGRYADEIPVGQVVELTPTDRAMILLKIKDNFPTQEFLGPMIVYRPELESEPGVVPTGAVSSEGWQPISAAGVVCSDRELPTELPSHWPKQAICLGPIRLKFQERFPFVSATGSNARRTSARSCLTSSGRAAIDPHHPLPPWAALHAGMLSLQSASGLSPPPPIGERGHSAHERCPSVLAFDVETCVSHLDL